MWWQDQLSSCIDQIYNLSAHVLPKKTSNPVIPAHTRSDTLLSDMSILTRIAGLSGASAVALAAYGSHKIRDDPNIEIKRKTAFDTGSRYHFYHTIALLLSSKARLPYVTAALMSGGIILFCGPCYHYSFTGIESTKKYTPVGGILFIIGWLSFIL